MKNKRIKQLGILLVLILVGIRFVLVPLSERHSNVVSENRILARKINKASTLWENRGALESRLSVLNQRLVDVIAMFPPVSPEDAKKFQLKQQQVIEKIVKGTGIRIKTLSWLPITSPFLHLIPVKMVGEGSPKDFYEVVRQLEARPEFVEIASLSIRKFGNKNIATGDFEISFYALDPEKMKSKNRPSPGRSPNIERGQER